MKLKELNKQLPISPMCEIAKEFGTDKYQYSRLYHEIMKDKRKNADIFEIGIYRGSSIKMWNRYFESGMVCGIDNGRLLPNSNINVGLSNQQPSYDDLRLLKGDNITYDFSWLESERIKCAIADQRNEIDVKKAIEHFGIDKFDFIVDDGHHFQEHQLKTLSLLLKYVKPGGFYIIEDVIKQSDLMSGSYWGQTKFDASDSTDFVFNRFIQTGEFRSEYLSEDQCKEITSLIDDVFIFHSPGPIQSTSNLIVIKTI